MVNERIIQVLFLGFLIYFLLKLPLLWSSITVSTVLTGYIFYKWTSRVSRIGPSKLNKRASDSGEIMPIRTEPLTTKEILNELYPRVSREEEERNVAEAIYRLVTYDAEHVQSLQNFLPVKEFTECIYAKTAKIWGSPDWLSHLELEENVRRVVPTFLKFTMVCRSRGLDGFLYEIPGKKYAYDIKSFGQSVRRIMKVISDSDPVGFHCMDKTYINQKGWVFQFNNCTFFITTFAPFYPETNPRYTFGCGNAYMLFQPEISFALHDLPPDSPDTNWECPITSRDKIRVAYKQAGRPFVVPSTLCYPMAPDIVKPVNTGDPIYEWWRPEDIK